MNSSWGSQGWEGVRQAPCHKRVLLAHLTPIFEAILPNEQASFRPGQSCCDQVLTITSYIEAGFQWNLKTGTALIDLSAAYNAIWRQGCCSRHQGSSNSIALCDSWPQCLSNRTYRSSWMDRSAKLTLSMVCLNDPCWLLHCSTCTLGCGRSQRPHHHQWHPQCQPQDNGRTLSILKTLP